MKIKTLLMLIFTSTFLIACKAEILEIDIKSKDVFSAANGEEEVVEFEAKFSNFGELDEESRAQVEALENILVKFMEITDFELETTDMGYEVTAVEDITGYPSILGGRVKTLHPKVFGGILNRQEVSVDQIALEQFEIPQIDLVIVDLYPFEDTVATGGSEQEIRCSRCRYEIYKTIRSNSDRRDK